jgi:hypothetical protein
MMYRFALEFIGPDTERGREFVGLRRYKEWGERLAAAYAAAAESGEVK